MLRKCVGGLVRLVRPWYLRGGGAAQEVASGWCRVGPGMPVGCSRPRAGCVLLLVIWKVPRVPQDVGPGDLPQEGGLERDAVCFTKGCFLGQEVMARLRSMGRLRRRLMRVRGEGALSGGLPAALYREGVRCGELRSVYCTEEGYVGLAMISLPVLGACRLLSLSPEGPANVIIQE